MKYLILLMLILGTSCNDFIETDLTDQDITVIAPSDNASGTAATVNFYWEQLEGARHYRVQVAKPGFENMVKMLADTLLTGTEFAFVFTPGNYQWRIRGENGSSQTPYVTRTLTIDSTSDLSSQNIILLNPVADYATNTGTVTFNCYGLYNATHYRWALKTHAAGFGGSLVMPDQLVADTFITVSGLPEGYLDWGMRGESSYGSTVYSARSIYVDYTNPAAPTLNLPANGNISIGPTFNLSWTHVDDNGSPLYDSVYIYNNSTLTNIERGYKITSGTTLTDTLADGTYYWRVKTIDKAGNKSAFSVSRWFKLN